MARLITAPFFPYLEESLLAEITAVKQEDPFRPVAVIVPTRALRRRLQSILASRGSWVNVDFFTFFTLSLRALSAAGHRVPPVAPPAVLSLLLKQVIESDLPESEHTNYFLSYTGSLARLLSLFSRFTAYRVTPPDRPTEIEKTLFPLYRAFCEAKQGRGIADADDIVDRAARLPAADLARGVGPTVFLYGFYDLNPIQADIVRLLDAESDLAILSPGGFSDGAEEFFSRTTAFYRDLSNNAGDPLPPAGQPEPVILSVARELFSAPEGPRREAGGAIELVTASGLHGEARAAALSIIGLKEKNPALAWRDIAVTMRQSADFAEVLADAFADYSIPAVFDGGRPLTSMPEAAYFLVLLSAMERGLPRDDVAYLVTSALFALPGLSPAEEPWVRDNAYLLAAFGRSYRVISGEKDWEKAFAEFKNRPAPDLFEEETGAKSRNDREEAMTRYVQAVRPIVSEFLRALSAITPEAEPSDYRDLFIRLIDTYVRPAHEGSPTVGHLKEILGTLTAVSAVRRTITRDECIALLAAAITGEKTPSAGDIDAVFVSDVMGLRGVAHKVLLLMGMNEKVFPRVASLDPFLSEETGAHLGMPTAYSRSLEDRTLFALTVGLARDLLIVTRQRSDDAGRTVAPSAFLAELVSRITIGDSPVTLASGPGPNVGRDYPRITATDAGLSRYRVQDVRASLCLGWPTDKDIRAVRSVVAATPFLHGGLTSVDERGSDRPFSRYDGLIGPADGLMDAALPLSSQKLETYMSCPFDFFMRFILSVREEEAVEEELDVEPRELGLINHRILSRLLPILVEKGFFGEPGADTELLDSLVGAHVKKETSRRLSGRIPALILRAREQHTARIVGRLIRRERDAVMPGSIPALYEVTFGPGAEGSPEGRELTLTIGPHTIDFVGRIDRIDINRAEVTFTVIDYKRKKPSAARKLKTEIRAGRHFQLPIYLMAADAFVPPETGRPGGGALVYLEAGDDADHRETLSREEYEETRGAVMEHIGAVVDEVRAGAFTPSRGTLCRFCAHRDLCRSDIKAVDTIRRQRSNGGRSEREETDDDA